MPERDFLLLLSPTLAVAKNRSFGVCDSSHRFMLLSTAPHLKTCNKVSKNEVDDIIIIIHNSFEAEWTIFSVLSVSPEWNWFFFLFGLGWHSGLRLAKCGAKNPSVILCSLERACRSPANENRANDIFFCNDQRGYTSIPVRCTLRTHRNTREVAASMKHVQSFVGCEIFHIKLPLSFYFSYSPACTTREWDGIFARTQITIGSRVEKKIYVYNNYSIEVISVWLTM